VRHFYKVTFNSYADGLTYGMRLIDMGLHPIPCLKGDAFYIATDHPYVFVYGSAQELTESQYYELTKAVRMMMVDGLQTAGR
jgi:hypothetical protein